MKSHINKAIILVCLASPFVFAMQEKVFTHNEIVLNLVTTHYLFDHEAVCSMGATSKYNNQLLVSMAQDRRKKLPTCPVYHPLSMLLHTYGTARCYAFESSESKELTLGYHELNGDKAITKYAKLQGFISPLWYKQQPFFNDEGNMCFHGYGRRLLDDNTVFVEGIFRFCMDSSMEYCIFDKKVDKYQKGLHHFLLYPSLLKAILKSQGEKTHCNPLYYSLPSVQYSLDEVIIPEDYDYKVVLPYIDRTICLPISLCEKLPDSMRTAIEKRLQEQAQSKNASL